MKKNPKLNALLKHIEETPEGERNELINYVMTAVDELRPEEGIIPNPMHFQPVHNRTLIFRHEDRAAIMIDFVDGTVALAENLTQKEAARIFWEAVRHYDDGEWDIPTKA